MKMKSKSYIRAGCHSFGVVCAVAVVLQFGVLASSAQTGQYLFTGSMTTITLNPGLYDITAYGARGGTFEPASNYTFPGGLGAEMSGEFYFSVSTTLTLVVGGSGGRGGPSGVFGGGGGGGGGSIIDSSAIMVLTKISGVASPDGSPNGEIIITAIPEPATWSLLALGIGALLGSCRMRRR